MQFSIAVPPGNLRGPEYTEQLLSVLHSACPRKWGLELHLRPLGATVGQACRLPSEVVPVFTERVADAYPDATIAPIPAAAEPVGTDLVPVAARELCRQISEPANAQARVHAHCMPTPL